MFGGWLGITGATLPWVILFTVILVGAGWGFGMFLSALGRALHTAWWNTYDAFWNWRDRT
jgi:hypothetical protein